MKCQRTVRVKEMMWFTNSTGPWKAKSLSRAPHAAFMGRAHSAAAFFWAGRELKWTQIPFRQGFAFRSITSRFKQGIGRLQWGMDIGFLLRCLTWGHGVQRMRSNNQLRVWHLTESKAWIRPGRIFNIFKYPHKSKNTTFCEWNCKNEWLFFSLQWYPEYERFPLNWFWQMQLNSCAINQHFKVVPF